MSPVDPSPSTEPTKPTESTKSSSSPPRVVLYAQTHHTNDEQPRSLLPLVREKTGVTHVILAALHLNDGPGNITLNDHHPDHPRFNTLWKEVKVLQSEGVKVCLMVGGAAKGSWERLEGKGLGSDEAKLAQFDAYIKPVIDFIRKRGLQGLDLDIEEEVHINTPRNTILRLHEEFGDDFIITLAPVCTALLPENSGNRFIRSYKYDFTQPAPGETLRRAAPAKTMRHLSGFSYPELFASDAGKYISWFNAQLYCGWADASNPEWYDAIIDAGWPADKIVLGVVTTPGNGPGYVLLKTLLPVIAVLRNEHPTFGGVMGWEYFNSGEHDPAMKNKQPWHWVKAIGQIAGSAEIPQLDETTRDRLGVLEEALGFGRRESLRALHGMGRVPELDVDILSA